VPVYYNVPDGAKKGKKGDKARNPAQRGFIMATSAILRLP